ncbi:MAG: hypothetical protein VR65_00640 [Desulfobulbaceae bacterium BRH_c16a]|nr:MAG: hypothetical protein VR65_00640 [Desulfobulbaceae bacterium BRH_c16a]
MKLSEGGPMKILVVDDNNEDRKVFRYIAERNGHEVLEAKDGREGLERAAACMPDLIISDALMPVMDGFHFLRHLKKNETLKSIPFIFYSATYTEEQDIRLGLSLGAEGYIAKPQDPVDLWQEVECIVQKAGQEKAATTELIKEEEDYLKKYSEMVAIKLERKIQLLEESQRSYKLLSEDLSQIVEELSESEKKFKDLTEQSMVGVYVLQNGVFKYMNPRFAEIFGYTTQELADKSYVNIVLPDDLPMVDKCVRKRLERQEEYGHYPFRGVKKNGELIYLEVYNTRTIYEGTPAIIGTLVDITARKQAEEQLQNLNDELERRVEERTLELQKTRSQYLHTAKLSAIGNLSASIAHEFNSPLQGILTILQSFRKKPKLEEEDMALLELAISECYRMKCLIRSLQDFNRPSSGLKVFMDVRASLDSVLLLCKSDFQRKRITTVLNYAERLPQILAIRDQIIQVFFNLLNNAADACLENGGVITISTWQEEKRIAVSIKDTGIGIKPERMDRIFQPFYTTKSVAKGTGLGLSVSHGIVQNHQGEIRVESRPGEGSTFTVLLPVVAE